MANDELYKNLIKQYLERTVTNPQIPEGVQRIGHYAFCDRVNMTSVVIPSTCKVILTYAFAGCVHLKNIEFKEGCIGIDTDSFNLVKRWGNYLPITYDEIENGTASLVYPTDFPNCELETLILPISLKYIGSYNFQKCPNLTTVIYAGQSYTSRSALLTAMKNNGVSFQSENNVFTETGLAT